MAEINLDLLKEMIRTPKRFTNKELGTAIFWCLGAIEGGRDAMREKLRRITKLEDRVCILEKDRSTLIDRLIEEEDGSDKQPTVQEST